MNTENAFGQPVGPAVVGWSERERPRRAPIPGTYCTLEPVADSHADDLLSAYAEAPDGRDWTYLFSERPETDAACRDYVARLSRSTDPLHFAILDGQTSKAIGTAALMRIDPVHGTIEVGNIAYAPSLMKSRAGTEAMYLLMRTAFDDLGYRRYEWKCDSLNAPSRAAAARYGFTFEGIFRKAIVYKGRSRDTAWYSMTLDEWPRIRQAFVGWLAADNFDAGGRQRRPLSAFRET